MAEKGCIFELFSEFDTWVDYLKAIGVKDVSEKLLSRVTSTILNACVEHALNSRLVSQFNPRADILKTVSDIIRDDLSLDLSRRDMDDLDNFLYDFDNEIYGRLKEMFHDVDQSYALWSTRNIGKTMVLVEYVGDYRIMEWHSRNDVDFKKSISVRYEFSLNSLYSTLDIILAQHRGKYAGSYFYKCLDQLVRNVVEDYLFFPEQTESDLYTQSDFNYTRKELTHNFPLMEREHINALLVDIETVLKSELVVLINSTLEKDKMQDWFINNRTLTIVVERAIPKIDHAEKMIDEIRLSLANGDWVPPKFRAIAEI